MLEFSIFPWYHVGAMSPGRADLRKYGVTIGCTACADVAVHGKTTKPHTDECRTRIGEHVDYDPGGQERVQAHQRKREVESEPDGAQAATAAERVGGLGGPTPLKQQDIATPAAVPAEPTSVKRGAAAVAPDGGNARLRHKSEVPRGVKHGMGDTPPGQRPKGGKKSESTQPLPELQEEVEGQPRQSLFWRANPSQLSMEVRARVQTSPCLPSTAVSMTVEDTAWSLQCCSPTFHRGAVGSPCFDLLLLSQSFYTSRPRLEPQRDLRKNRLLHHSDSHNVLGRTLCNGTHETKNTHNSVIRSTPLLPLCSHGHNGRQHGLPNLQGCSTGAVRTTVSQVWKRKPLLSALLTSAMGPLFFATPQVLETQWKILPARPAFTDSTEARHMARVGLHDKTNSPPKFDVLSSSTPQGLEPLAPR